MSSAPAADVATNTMNDLSMQDVSKDVLLEKYCKGDETSADDVFRRVAKGIAQAEKTKALRTKWEGLFLENMRNGAIGAGRIMSAGGSGIKATLANCFVQPVGDAIEGIDEEGFPGIYDALKQAAETMRRGGGVGYDFSPIRPKGSKVKGTASEASGPCSYMNVFDKSCETVESAGSRRGAQMGVLRCDHPDIEEFIVAKRTKGRWNNFNVSVGINHGFMEAVTADAEWDLVHKAEPSEKQKAAGAYLRSDGKWVYKKVRAKEMYDIILKSTYDFAEPGVLFLDNMNRDNNLRYTETIAATNPCGEQPLPSYGCCDLGPIILSRFVREPFTAHATFDREAFRAAVAIQVRFLDNVLDVTHWPLDEQRTESQNKRRIGVGYTGLGNALTMLGVRYNSQEGRDLAADLTREMRDAAYSASVELAKEKGPFPLFDAKKYLEAGTFASRLPEPIKKAIRTHGIRNSHLLSIAPTGTVSLAFADNASGGIEPAFSWAYTRKKRVGDGHVEYAVKDHAFRLFSEIVCPPELREGLVKAVCNFQDSFEVDGTMHRVSDVLPAGFVTALEMSADEHLLMMAAVQPYVDTSISKTVNVPADYPYEDFKGLYLKAWSAGLKGLATYRPNDTLGSVLSVPAATATPAAPTAAPAPADVDPLRVPIDSRPLGDLAAVSSRFEYWTSEGKKSAYVIVSFARVEGMLNGEKVEIERPIEFFLPGGQLGDSQQWISSNMRLLSMVARSGGSVAKALQNMREVEWDKGQVTCGTYTRPDGYNVPRGHKSEVAAIGYMMQKILVDRGFLDAEFNQIPTTKLAARKANTPTATPVAPTPAAPAMSSGPSIGSGKACPECGAHSLHKRDGCEKCDNCGYLGHCG